MHKLLTGLAAASALFAFATAAQAECYGSHNVTASADTKQEAVASTAVEAAPLSAPAAAEESSVAQLTLCAEGEKDCSTETNSAAKH